MALLKEDGSLDIERINSLPLEEYMNEMSNLAQEQIDEYMSKLPLNESSEQYEGVEVDYSLEEDIERNGIVNADEFLNNLWKKYGIE